ncbi:MAG: hypothetical protein GDA36_04815 [Rhodobacteraceae bacterium]|nr:hypothetical protein [Paracoccaceae bacterium]
MRFAILQKYYKKVNDLRATAGQAFQPLLNKVLNHLDHIRSTSRFVLIGSGGHEGCIDLLPKGDPAGFVKVLGTNPDRPSNRRFDIFSRTLRNSVIFGGCFDRAILSGPLALHRAKRF